MHKQPDVTAATRKKIMDSFWEIYIFTPLDKITISAITKSAGIHRSTFYEYFKDIYDLLEQLENDLLEQIEYDFSVITQENPPCLQEQTSPMNIHDFINSTLSFFTKYGEMLCHLLGASGDPSFRQKMFDLFKIKFLFMHNIPEDYPYADYLVSFVFAIISNDLEYWYQHRDSITMHEVITLTYKLIGSGLENHFFELIQQPQLQNLRIHR
ncbi:MAG: TetR/AcrR family transcriptional regulator [Lachnospiraceae bacterium]|nr:TetR/AcrR family transcriptional regulator [Lachnospiraceae bacterium]